MGRVRVAGRLLIALAALVASVAVSGSHAAADDELPRPDPPDPTTWYTPVVPARILDTRSDAITVDGLGRPGQRLGEGRTIDVQVWGRGGIPATGVSAVVLNVTAVSPDSPSFITVWPTGATRPEASNLNVVPGQVVPNAVVAKLGTAGNVSLFNHAGTTDLVADVVGYFPEDDAFVPVVPARLLETRPGLPTQDGVSHVGHRLGAGESLAVDVTGRAGVPDTGVDTVVLNVTAVDPTASSYLTVWPGGTRPLSSNLNFGAAETVPNLVFAKVGADGTVSIYNHSGSVDVVADIAGYFPTDSTFVGVTPTRLMDTRRDQGIPFDGLNARGPLDRQSTIDIRVLGTAGVPAERVSAVVLNVTAVNASAQSFISVWPTGTERPTASNLNTSAGGSARPNLVVAKVGAGGNVSLYNHEGLVDVVVDIAGYFLEEPSPIREFATADTNSCVLDWLGRVTCWGTLGQDPTPPFVATSNPKPPHAMNTFDDVVDIAVAGNETCVLRVDESVWCWSTSSFAPILSWTRVWPASRVTSLGSVRALDGAGDRICALHSHGEVSCWVRDMLRYGPPEPIRIPGLDDAVGISVSSTGACALRASGGVACWGTYGESGMLGDGRSVDSPLDPVAVTGIDDAIGVAVGADRACAARSDGTLACWGRSYLGDGLETGSPQPVTVIDGPGGPPLTDALALAPGSLFACALLSDDQVYCWGDAMTIGLLPPQYLTTSVITEPEPGLPPIALLAATSNHVCGVSYESDVFCWGDNSSFRFAVPPGDNANVSPDPVLVYSAFA